MNRSRARWTTAFAAAALIGLPAGAWAQTPPATAQQPPAAQAPSAQTSAALEHLQKASAALNDIPAASLTGRAQTRVTELKSHISALEKMSAAKPPASSAAKWGAEVAAADKILNELVGPAGATPAGTSGTTAAPVQLDDAARTKLMEVRNHLTAFAAAMSGAAAPKPPSADPPMATTMTTEPPATQPPATQPPATATQPPAAPAGQPNPEVAKQHLTAARDALAQVTQLPAAAQLTGDARTQVSQLITNFNALITAKENWGEEYKKVDANLTALIGAQTTDESPSTPTSATAGAVGTSGSVTLDPAIRAKLVELRTHLNAFNKAAGGGAPAVNEKADPAAAAVSPETPAGTTAPSPETSPAGPADALRHLAAIEAILNTQAGANAGITLDRTQMEQLRTHMNELRRILSQK